MSTPVVALAGNPNTGKTTLFNRLTGHQGRVGNYPGVTVELMGGRMETSDQGSVEVIDIPGAYSLLVRSAEEQVAVQRLGVGDQQSPDAVIVCVDATNLLRNLYLVLQLQELGANVLVALTMIDEAGDTLPEPRALSERLGCPVIPISVPRNQGIDALRDAVGQALVNAAPEPGFRWQPSEPLREELERVQSALPQRWERSQALALWALQSFGPDGQAEPEPELLQALQQSHLDGAAIDDEAITGRYAWLDREIGPLLQAPPNRQRTDRADRVLIHPVWGFSVFMALMFVLFQSLFAWADPAIGAVETIFGWMGSQVRQLLPPGLVADFLVEGIIGGVGSVVVFLPQILLLFFFIGMMEDSGYMARVAYLMDRIMRSMNLHGRAFVPMLSGFACAVPAIMATRTMERKRDRFLTMMVVPLMTCSARLPVFTLMIGALFPAATVMGFLPLQGLLMIAMYLLSMVTALVAAWVLSRTVFKAPPVPLVLELPPYRMPRLRDVLRMMWQRTRYFLTEAGTVILACTVVLWFLLSFPRHEEVHGPTLAGADPAGQLEAQDARAASQLRQSYGGRLGKAIEPLIEPLGFDWKIGVGLIGAFAAREVFVATLGVVYSAGDVDEESATLRERMRTELREDGSRVYTPLTGLSLMVFFALACQCMSTLAVVKRETKGYRWPVFLFTYMTLLAWVAALLTYQGGRLLGFT